MKKLIGAMLITTMFVGSLAACTNNTTKETTVATEETTTEATEVTTEETTVETTTTETTPKPTATPKPTPTPEVEFEVDMDKVATYEQIWTNNVTGSLDPLEINNDMVYCNVSIPDLMDGSANIVVYYKKLYTEEQAKAGSPIFPFDNDVEYKIGDDFESDIIVNGKTTHIIGRKIEDLTRFDDDGYLDTTDSCYWLEYDAKHEAWVLKYYTYDDGIGMSELTSFFGYQTLPVASTCELYFDNGATPFEYDASSEEMTDKYGSYAIKVDSYYSSANKFVPVNGSENVFADFVRYNCDLSDYAFTQGGNSSVEEYGLTWGDKDALYALPVNAFVLIKNGEITKVYFTWISCGAVHWGSGETVLGTFGTGEYYILPY